MPPADGQLISVDLTVIVFGVALKVIGTIEVLAVRKNV